MATPNELRDKQIVSWNERDQPVIQRNLDALMKFVFIQNGRPAQRGLFAPGAHQHILASYVRLAQIESMHLKRHLVFRASLRLRTLAKQDLATFRRVLAAGVRKHQLQPPQTFHVVFPFHVDPATLGSRRWFTVLGVRLVLRTWRYVERSFRVQRWLEDVKRSAPAQECPLGSPFFPLVVSISRRTPEEAFDAANDAFDLFRTILNMTETFGAFTQQIGGLPKPLAKIIPPPIYGIFDENGAFVISAANERLASGYQMERLPQGQMQAADRLLRMVKSPGEQGETYVSG